MNDEEEAEGLERISEEFYRMREEYERELFALPDARTIEYWTAYEE